MNKMFLAVCCAFLFWGQSVKAENKYVPYIGVDASYSRAKTSHTSPKYGGAYINLGTTYNTYFGTEIFYHQTFSNAKQINANDKYKTSYRAYGLDAIATLHVHSKFDLAASLGLATYVLSEKKTNMTHATDEGIGYRFGVGAVYHLTSRIDIRANARYVKTDHISNLKHLGEYTFGMRYFFGKD